MTSDLFHDIPAFESDEHYWAFELRRLEEQLSALVLTRGDPSQRAQLAQLAGQRLEQRHAIRDVRAEAVARGVSIPWHLLIERFELSMLDEYALLIAAAPSLEPTLARQVTLLQREQRLTQPAAPSLGLVETLIFGRQHARASARWAHPDGKLRRHGLLELEGNGHTPWVALSVVVPGSLMAALHGEQALDERLSTVAELGEPSRRLVDVVLPESLWQQVNTIVGGVVQRKRSAAWLLGVCGPRQCGKSSLLDALAAEIGAPRLHLHGARLAALPDAARLLRLAVCNASLCRAMLHVDGVAGLFERRPELVGHLCDLVHQLDGLVALEVEDSRPLPPALSGHLGPLLELPMPNHEARIGLWERALDAEVELDETVAVDELALHYDLSGAQMETAVRWAQVFGWAQGSRAIGMAHLRASAEHQMRSELGDLLSTGRAELGIDDLVLPGDAMASVRELLDACRVHRDVLRGWGLGRRLVTGRGIVALFSGEPGTGKSLCAEVLANALGLELHTVNVPSVLSRWVGETEKNLSRLFGDARADNSVLLFDEADSLFGKRVQVERAQDHYQNLAVNQLLREIERYEGIVILTTNLEKNLDKAFERRILYRIDFPEPNAAARLAIWRTLIPAQMPREDDVDLEVLAEDYALTGGLIKNALVAAAYACRAAGTALSQEALERAAHRQAAAAGRLTRGRDHDMAVAQDDVLIAARSTR